MKSILKKKIFKRKIYKRVAWIAILFLISVVALKHLEKQHPLPPTTQSMEDIQKPVAKKDDKPKKPLTVAQKKQLFKDKLVPALNSAYKKLDDRYKEIKELINKDPKSHRIAKLKEEYNAKTNHDLLLKLKPHPKSVTLAQAAIESAWGTSRFFIKANNVFGVWSFNKKEPRIAASETRGVKTIYLKKYKSIEDSILDYYKILSKAGAYHKFRVQNYKDPNPYLLVKHLDKYSEKRAKYGEILTSVIGFNKFSEYDEKFYPRPPKPPKKTQDKIIIKDKNTTQETNSTIVSNTIIVQNTKSETILNNDNNNSIKK